MLAAAILASVVLYLVDKNHQWKNFWRVTAGAALVAVSVVGYMAFDDYRQSKKSAAAREMMMTHPDFIPAVEVTPPPGFVIDPPETLPADFNKWDKAPKGAKKCILNSDPHDPLCIRENPPKSH